MKTLAIYLQYTGKELLAPVNYLLAFIVGSIISLSQHSPLFGSAVPFIVPLLVHRSSRHYKPAFAHEKTVSILKLDDRSGISGEQIFGGIMDSYQSFLPASNKQIIHLNCTYP